MQDDGGVACGYTDRQNKVNISNSADVCYMHPITLHTMFMQNVHEHSSLWHTTFCVDTHCRLSAIMGWWHHVHDFLVFSAAVVVQVIVLGQQIGA